MSYVYKHKRFQPKSMLSGVDVYFESGSTIRTKSKGVKINWGCCGSVSLEQAIEFRNAFNKAIRYAKKIEENNMKNITNEQGELT